MKKLFILLNMFILLFLYSCLNSHNVTIENNNGSQQLKIEVGNNDILPDLEEPTKEGYKFIGYYYNDKPFDLKTKITEDITIYAQYEQIVYTITYIPYKDNVNDQVDKNDLNILLKNYNINNIQQLINLKDRKSQTFDGWYLEDTFEKKVYDTSSFNTDIILYGKWIDRKYQVIFYLDNTLNNIFKEVSINHSNSLDLEFIGIPIKEGYTFKNWQYYDSINNIYIDIDNNTVVNNNLKIYPLWDKN